jgi:hypothetical protein
MQIDGEFVTLKERFCDKNGRTPKEIEECTRPMHRTPSPFKIFWSPFSELWLVNFL